MQSTKKEEKKKLKLNKEKSVPISTFSSEEYSTYSNSIQEETNNEIPTTEEIVDQIVEEMANSTSSVNEDSYQYTYTK